MRFNYWQTFYEGGYYHVYNRAVGRDSIFLNDGNYKFFLKKWVQYIHAYVDTYAYCLMGNHFHYLIRIKPITDSLRQHVQAENTVASKRFYAGEIKLDVFLEDQFKRYFSAYTLAYNKQHKRHGGLF